MVQLTPVDHDPFADAGPSLTPVDHDPFAPAPTWADSAKDAAQTALPSLARGAAALAGLPGDAASALNMGIDKATSALGASPPPLPDVLPTTKNISDVTGVSGLHQPTTGTGKVVNAIGEMAPAALMGPGSVASNLARFAVAPGAVSEAAGQIADKATNLPDWASPAIRATTALGTAAFGHKLITPRPVPPQFTADVGALRDAGVPVSAGDATNNPNLRWWENDLNPGGNPTQREAFTNAALRRGGVAHPEGLQHGAGGTVDNLLTDTGARLDALEGRNRMEGDTQLGDALRDTWRQYASVTPPSARAPIVTNTIRELGDAIPANGGSLPGDVYQSLRSRLRDAQRATKTDAPLQEAIGDMASHLDDAMERSIGRNNPNDLGAFQQARGDYRRALVIEKAAGMAGPGIAQGEISPAQLASASKAVYGKRAYERGYDPFSTLSQPGVAVLKQLPDSGTSQRNRINSVIRAGGAGIGAAIGGHMGGVGGAGEGGVLGLLLGESVGEPIARAIARRAIMNPVTQGYLGNQALPRLPGLLSTRPGQVMGAQDLSGLLSPPPQQQR